MQEYPHRYEVSAEAPATGEIIVASKGLQSLPSLAPAEFGGPGDLWSPETFLVAAVADCFILTFRAVARASKLEWSNIESSAVGVLDRVDRLTQFTSFTVSVTLTVPAGTDVDKVQRLLEKSEAGCLITNSLRGETHLKTEIILQS
jgi:peroxiredoxin-like protein